MSAHVVVLENKVTVKIAVQKTRKKVDMRDSPGYCGRLGQRAWQFYLALCPNFVYCVADHIPDWQVPVELTTTWSLPPSALATTTQSGMVANLKLV